MIANGLMSLGIVGVVASLSLGLGFMIADVPYTSPYTDWTWGLQIAGFVILMIGALLKRMT